MIAKFNSICMYCGKPAKAGVDIYDQEIKKSYHEDCRDNQPPGLDTLRLAERLGYVQHNDIAISSAVQSWRVCQDWALRHLFTRDRNASAGRLTTTALPGSHPSLFDNNDEESVTA